MLGKNYKKTETIEKRVFFFLLIASPVTVTLKIACHIF